MISPSLVRFAVAFSIFTSAIATTKYPQFAPAHRVHSLDGVWEFAFLGTNAGDPVTIHPTSIKTSESMIVPGAFDNYGSLMGVRGTALYRTTFTTTPGANGKLFFAACSFYCAVYINGVRVADHGIGYSPFWVGGFAPLATSQTTLEVIVDNRFNTTRSYLHGANEGYDFYQYGGIIRSVQYHEWDSAALALQAADVLIRNASAGAVDVRIRVHDVARTTWLFPPKQSGYGNVGDVDRNELPMYAPVSYGNGFQALPTSIVVNVSFDFATTGNSVRTVTVPIDMYGAGTATNILVPNPILWSPTTPNLHTIHVSVVQPAQPVPLPTGASDLVDSFGLRTISVCDASAAHPAVCINGVPTKLLGFSKHDVHVEFASATPTLVHWQDYSLVRSISPPTTVSSPYFRLVHYPHPAEELDIADKMGVPVWQEALGWGNSESFISDPKFVEQQLLCIEEYVNHTSFNHPSGILFAFLNEGASDNAASCPTYTRLSQRYKQLGVNGLVTWASDKGEKDVCLSAADVVSFNSYPGWYGWSGTLNASLASIVPTIDTEAAWVAQHQTGKPFIKSEIGAGAVPGFRDAFQQYWSEEYQASVDGIVATAVATDPRFTGVSLWQWCDARTGALGGNGALSRPRSFNNKGAHDEYRRPKLAVQAIRSGFAQARWQGRPIPSFDEQPPQHQFIQTNEYNMEMEEKEPKSAF